MPVTLAMMKPENAPRSGLRRATRVPRSASPWGATIASNATNVTATSRPIVVRRRPRETPPPGQQDFAHPAVPVPVAAPT